MSKHKNQKLDAKTLRELVILSEIFDCIYIIKGGNLID